MTIADHAFLIAKNAHAGQFRADGITPYFEHPKAVARIFLEAYQSGGYRMLASEDEYLGQAVAFLHDAVEDGGTTFEELEKSMPPKVMEALKLLTHFKGDSYLDYLLMLKRSHNNLAIQVKLADMTANLADLDNLPSKAARKGLKIKYELARYILTHP